MFGISRMFLAVTRSLGVEIPIINNYKDTVLNLNPVAYWRLGETTPGTGIAKDEMLTYDGTYVASPTGVTGLLVNDNDGAVEFDGVDQSVENTGIGSELLTHTTGSISFSAKIASGDRAVLCFGNDLEPRIYILILLDETDCTVNYRYNSDVPSVDYFEVNSIASFDINTNYHIVLVQDDINFVNMYIDGVLQSVTTSGTISGKWFNDITGGSLFSIGASADSTPFFDSSVIDEVAIFDTALTQAQVTDLYNASISNFKSFDILIDHTKFDEDVYNFPVLVNLDTDSGIGTFDTSAVFSELYAPTDPYYNNSVLMLRLTGDNNSTTFTDISITPSDITVEGGSNIVDTIIDPFGEYNGVMYLDGTTDSIYTTTTQGNVNTGDFSAECWFMPETGVDCGGGIIGTSINDSYNERLVMKLVGTSSPYSLNVSSQAGSGTGKFTKSTGTVLDNEWTHLAFQRKAGIVYLYVNGVMLTSADLSNDIDTGIIRIGHIYSGSTNVYSRGYFSDAKVYYDAIYDITGFDIPTVRFPTDIPDPVLTGITTTYNQPSASDLPEYAVEVMSLNPVVYWRLGEASGTEAKDETGNYSGTYVNAPLLGVTGLLVNDTDTAVEFDGIEKYVDCSINSVSSISGDVSLSIIFNTTTPAESVALLGINAITTYTNTLVVLLRTDGAIAIYSDDVGSTFIGSGFADGTNHILNIIFNSNNTMNVYVDNILYSQNLASPTLSDAGTFYIGTELDSGGVFGNYFPGTIDEVAIFDTALTQAEVTRLYNKSVNAIALEAMSYSELVTSYAPVAYWRLGEAIPGTGTAIDETGNYNGTYVGSPVSTTGLLTNDNDTAVEFDGATQYVERIESDFRSGDTQGSIVASIKISALSSDYIFSSSDQIEANDKFVIYTREDGLNTRLAMFTRRLGVYNQVQSTTIVNDGNLHHIAVISNGSAWEIYIDGIKEDLEILQGTNTGYWFSDIPNRDAFQIAAEDSSLGIVGHFDGTIDEIAIFDTALTQQQVTDLYNKATINKIGAVMPPAVDDITTQIAKTEIDRWDQINSQAQLWVKVPYISKDVDTILNLSYDSNNADNSENIGITGTVPAKAVWSEYDAVYHLSKDGADSAANSLDGTLEGGIDATNIVDFGIGKGMTFDGVGEYVSLPDLSHGSTGEITLEVIVQTTLSDLVDSNRIIELNTSITTDPIIILHYSVDEYPCLYVGHNTIVQDFKGDSLDVHNQHHVTGVSQENTNGLIYIDAELDASTTDVAGLGDYKNNAIGQNNAIGSDRHDTPGSFINGKIKEIRFAKNLKSGGWIASNYDSTQDTLARYKNK